jgi:hypothetical protein
MAGWRIQYQVQTEPVSTRPETTTVDRWHQPLSQPVLRAGLAVAVIASGAVLAPPQVAAAPVTSIDRYLQPLSQPVLRTGIGAAPQPAATWSTFTPQAAAVTIGWMAPLSQPALPAKEGGDVLALSVSQDPETTTVDRWHQPLGTPLRAAWRPALFQSTAWVPSTTQAVTVNFGWFQQFLDPRRASWSPSSQPAFTTTVSQSPEATTVDRWLTPFGVPVPRGGASLAALLSGSLLPPPQITAPIATSEDRWHQPFAQPVLRAGLGVALQPWGATEPVSEAPESTSVDRWYQPFGTPVLRLSYAAAMAAGQVQGSVAAPEAVTLDKWYAGLSQPTRRTPQAAIGQVAYITPIDAVSIDRWLQPLGQPYFPRRLPPITDAPTWAPFTPAPTVVPSFGWFVQGVDVMRPGGLWAAQQQAIAWNSVFPIPPNPPPAVVPPTSLPGPADGIWDADEQRKRWIAWSQRRKPAKAVKVVPPPAPAPSETLPPISVTPPPPPKFLGLPTPEMVQALLEANARAVREQQISDAVIHAARLKQQQDDDDDDDAAIFLLDD